MIKGDHPVNLCAREVQLLGDHRDGSSGNAAEGRLHAVQYFEERTRSVTVLGHDASNSGTLLGR